MTQQRNRGLIAALVLGLLAASVPAYAQPMRYEATTMIQVRSVVPSFIGNDRQLNELEYNRFVNTQIALLKHPSVLDRALEVPGVAPLPLVREQKDKRAWLTKELQVTHAQNSEILYVRITTNSADASEKINNAVVMAYLAFIDEIARRSNNELMNNLRVEERRQRQLANGLQESIRRKTREAVMQGIQAGDGGMSVGIAQGESLVRDVALANAKLTAMRAQRKAIIERMEGSVLIPVSMLIQLNPELKILNEERNVLVQRRKMLAETFSNPDDPRIVQIGRQIEQIDERVKTLATDVDFTGASLDAARDHFRFQEEVNLYQLDLEIRVQEILVADLTAKLNEQLIKGVERAESVLDVSFEQSQLDRVHRTLDKIEDRILAISTELRAPGQIIPLSAAVVSEVPR